MRAQRAGQSRPPKANLCPPPPSTYQVIVEEDRPKKIKRELGGQECFPVPLTFDDAVSRGSVHYFGAELPASSLTEAKPFTVGDNQTYSGYWNPPLEPKKAYLIYFQAMSNLKGVSSHVARWVPVGATSLLPALWGPGGVGKWGLLQILCFRSSCWLFALGSRHLGPPWGALGVQLGAPCPTWSLGTHWGVRVPCPVLAMSAGTGNVQPQPCCCGADPRSQLLILG